MDVSGGFDDYKPAIISAVIIMNITLNILVIAVIASYPQLREDRTFSLRSNKKDRNDLQLLSYMQCSVVTKTVVSTVYSFIYHYNKVSFKLSSLFCLMSYQRRHLCEIRSHI